MTEAKEVRDVLQRVLPRLKPQRGGATERLQAVWREITKGEEARQSRVSQFRNGVLLIEVDSAPMMHHISGKGKEHLLRRLREKVEGIYIKEIRARLAREEL